MSSTAEGVSDDGIVTRRVGTVGWAWAGVEVTRTRAIDRACPSLRGLPLAEQHAGCNRADLEYLDRLLSGRAGRVIDVRWRRAADEPEVRYAVVGHATGPGDPRQLGRELAADLAALPPHVEGRPLHRGRLREWLRPPSERRPDAWLSAERRALSKPPSGMHGGWAAAIPIARDEAALHALLRAITDADGEVMVSLGLRVSAPTVGQRWASQRVDWLRGIAEPRRLPTGGGHRHITGDPDAGTAAETYRLAGADLRRVAYRLDVSADNAAALPSLQSLLARAGCGVSGVREPWTVQRPALIDDRRRDVEIVDVHDPVEHTATLVETLAPPEASAMAAMPRAVGGKMSRFCHDGAGLRQARKGGVFVSYSRFDTAQSEAVIARLQDAGLDVWWDVGGIDAGASFDDDIAEAIEAARCVVVIVSADAHASKYMTREELRHARRSQKPIVEAIVDDSRPFYSDRNAVNVGRIVFGDQLPVLDHLVDSVVRHVGSERSRWR